MSTPFPVPRAENISKPIDFNEDYDTSSLKGQNALVTGGATGIGQGCAVGLAEAGAYVTIVDVNEKDAQETVEDLTKRGYKAQFVKTDVSSWKELVVAFKAAVDFGPENTLDIVVAAAGIGGTRCADWLANPKLNEAGDPEPVEGRALDINLSGVFDTAHLALYYFKTFPGEKPTDKQIVFVASMAGYGSMMGLPDYGASKWGVRGLFRSLRGMYDILGEKNRLRCNQLAPGFVRTNMTKPFWDLEERTGMRMAKVADCVHVVLRMCADESVVGRSASIAGEKKNFDLCDDPEGMDASRVLSERRRTREAATAQP